MQKNQHIHVAIKLQHILETDDKFRRSAGLPRLDLPEHLWGIQDMQSAHSREQDFMAITAEVKVLHQQLKGKGMYTVPPTFSTTSDPKPGNNVHFQPIDLAHKSSVHTMDQSLLNSSLNLLDDSPRPQSSSSDGQIPCGQATPQGSVLASDGHVPLAFQLAVPPTLYVNQTAVNQHMGTQPAPIPPRMSTGPMNLQPPTKTPPSQVPSDIQPQRLAFVDAPPAPTKDYSADNTDSPSTCDTRSKSTNRQGIKQISSASSSYLYINGKVRTYLLELWRSRTLEAQLSKPTILFQVQANRALTCEMPTKRQEEGDIPNTTKNTTDVSGPEVF